MKRVKSERLLFLYCCFYDFDYETKTVELSQFIVQIAMPFVFKKRMFIFFH
jgi:hypothetical protein